MKWLTPKRRRALYVITAAALVVAATYGLIDGEQSAAWLGLVAAVLGVATANVSDEDA